MRPFRSPFLEKTLAATSSVFASILRDQSPAYYFLLPILFSLLGSCAVSSPPLLIATASSNQFMMEAIVEAFTQQTDIETELIVGSSGKLTAQIIAGAPYDIFVSADARYPKKLRQAGKLASVPICFGWGSLVLWSKRTDSEPNLDSLSTNDRLVIANPASAPFGRLADSLLRLRTDYDTAIQPRLVYGESISQVNQFVTTAAVQLGLTAKSVVLAPKVGNQGRWVDFGPAKGVPQTVVVIKSDRTQEAERFIAFLISKEGRIILAEYGIIDSTSTSL